MSRKTEVAKAKAAAARLNTITGKDIRAVYVPMKNDVDDSIGFSLDGTPISMSPDVVDKIYLGDLEVIDEIVDALQEIEGEESEPGSVDCHPHL